MVVELNDPHGVGVVHLRQVVIIQVLHPRVLVESNVSLCPEKAPIIRAFSLLKVPTIAFTIKNPYRHYAKRVKKHDKQTLNKDACPQKS